MSWIASSPRVRTKHYASRDLAWAAFERACKRKKVPVPVPLGKVAGDTSSKLRVDGKAEYESFRGKRDGHGTVVLEGRDEYVPHIVSDPNTAEAKAASAAYWDARAKIEPKR